MTRRVVVVDYKSGKFLWEGSEETWRKEVEMLSKKLKKVHQEFLKKLEESHDPR